MFRSKEDIKRIAELEKEVENLKSKLSKMQKLDTVEEDLNSCEFEFDFKSMSAFSIERIYENGSLRTVIGYEKNRNKEGVEIGQWLFYCSKDEHNKLVEKLRTHLKSKKATK